VRSHPAALVRRIAVLASLVAALIVAAPASALAVHSASCGWSTSGAQFYSPTYNEFPMYVGHVVLGGHYYRQFADYNGAPWYSYTFLHYSVVYCG
jgi:hypothetical protein